MAVNDLLKLRCPMSLCKAVRVPAGTDLTKATTGVAGTFALLGAMLVAIKNTVALTVAYLTTAETVGLYTAQDVGVPAKTEAWSVGQAVYFDGSSGQRKFTVTNPGNLKRCGTVIEAKAAAATVGYIDFDGTGPFAAADVNEHAAGFALACPKDRCELIAIPIGHDTTAYGELAGDPQLVEDVLAILVETATIAANKTTTATVEAASRIPKYNLPAAKKTAAETWKAGELIYFDVATKKFSNVATNLSACGVSLAASAAGAAAVIRLDGEFVHAVADIDKSS